jgi:hypothetical protein
MAKSHLTPKENFLRLTREEVPENIPIFTMAFPVRKCRQARRAVALQRDAYPAVPAAATRTLGRRLYREFETNFACIPEPNNFILEDITKWPRSSKKRTAEHIGWEKLAKADIEASGRPRAAGRDGRHRLMPFQQVIAFMGFTTASWPSTRSGIVRELITSWSSVYAGR